MIIEHTGQNGPAELSVQELSNQHFSFDTFLDDVCERLSTTRQQGSLKRIRILEEKLDALDKELDELAEASQTDPASQANPDRE